MMVRTLGCVLLAWAFAGCAAPRTVEELHDAFGFGVTQCTGPDCARIGDTDAISFTQCTDWIAVDSGNQVWRRNGCRGEEAFHTVGSIGAATRLELDAAHERARGDTWESVSERMCYATGRTWHTFEWYSEDGASGEALNYCQNAGGPSWVELERVFEGLLSRL